MDSQFPNVIELSASHPEVRSGKQHDAELVELLTARKSTAAIGRNASKIGNSDRNSHVTAWVLHLCERFNDKELACIADSYPERVRAWRRGLCQPKPTQIANIMANDALACAEWMRLCNRGSDQFTPEQIAALEAFEAATRAKSIAADVNNLLNGGN